MLFDSDDSRAGQEIARLARAGLPIPADLTRAFESRRLSGSRHSGFRGIGGGAAIPSPAAHKLAFSHSGFNGGYGEAPTAAALEPTAATTIIVKAYSLDPAGFSGAGEVFWSSWDTAANKGRLLAYRNTTNDTQLVVGHSNSGAGADGTALCTVYGNVSTWTENADHELAFVFDGAGVGNSTRAFLYLDGVAIPGIAHFGTWPATLSAPGAPLNLGHRKGSGVGYVPWQGYLWDYRQYSVALSAAQIAAAYANANDPALPTPAARWQFSEATGATYTSSPGGYVMTATATGTGRAPTRVIDGWYGGGVGSGSRVLCIGDSYTNGFGYTTNYTGWRSECRNRLYSVHKKRFDFVGPNSDATSQPSGFLDVEHGGVDGRQIDAAAGTDMVSVAPGWMATYDPSAVVLWGGYNDIATGAFTAAQTRDHMETLARAVNTAKPGVQILIVNALVVGSASAATVLTYSGLLPALITTLQGDSINATLVDVAAVTSICDIIPADNIHPHNIGYERCANAIADALAGVL